MKQNSAGETDSLRREGSGDSLVVRAKETILSRPWMSSSCCH